MQRPEITIDFTEPDRDRLSLPVVLLATCLSALPAAMIAMMPVAGEPVAVIFERHTSLSDRLDAVTSAGGALIDISLTGRLIIAASADPGFHHRLEQEGAVFLIHGRLAQALCGGA